MYLIQWASSSTMKTEKLIVSTDEEPMDYRVRIAAGDESSTLVLTGKYLGMCHTVKKKIKLQLFA